jgi:hypothetical protein
VTHWRFRAPDQAMRAAFSGLSSAPGNLKLREFETSRLTALLCPGPEDGAPRDWTRAHFAAGTKVLFFIKRRSDVSVEDFRGFMAERADRLTRARPAMLRYVHGWVHPGPEGAEPMFDCVDEMCWTGTARVLNAGAPPSAETRRNPQAGRRRVPNYDQHSQDSTSWRGGAACRR